MKKVLKQSAVLFFIAVLLCFGALMCSAAEDGTLEIFSRSMNVGVGQITEVYAEVKGAQLQPEITWSSSDEAVATVEGSGFVKGIKKGTAVITATAVYEGKTLTATYPMEVIKKSNIIHSYMEFNPVLSFQYCYDYCGFFYANDKVSWQENFGFTKIYDVCAPLIGFCYDVLRAFFTFDGKDFMVELWKGEYTTLYGGEVGIYTKEADGKEPELYTFYNPAEEEYWPIVDMAVYHQKKEGDAPEDYELLLKRPVDRYWWCTGFTAGFIREYFPADELRVEASLTFDQQEIAVLLADAFEESGLTRCENKESLVLDSFCLEGNTVSFSWQNVIVDNSVKVTWDFVTEFVVEFIKIMLKWDWKGIFQYIF